MNTHSTEAAQVPLIELLREVPTTARLQIDDGEFSTQYIPVGRYCHEAAAAISQHEADRARQEPVAPEWQHNLLGEWNATYPRMDIYSKPGTLVVFDGRGGHDSEKKHAEKVLKLRHTYEVDRMDVGSCSSSVRLKGIDGMFNTCLFAAAPHPAPTNPAAQERPCTCHPDDSPPIPCARKYALTECRAAQERAEPVAPAVETDREAFEHRMLDFGWCNFTGGMEGSPPFWCYMNSDLNARWIGWREACKSLSTTPPAPAQPSRMSLTAAVQPRPSPHEVLTLKTYSSTTQPSPESKPEQAEAPNIPKELDVRTILLEVVPGDGDGFEVFAKSVADVEAHLGKIGEELEDWQLGIRRYATLPPAIAAGDSGAGERNIHHSELLIEIWPPTPKKGMIVGMSKGVKITHRPTGTAVACDTERSQHLNRDKALDMLYAALATKPQAEQDAAESDSEWAEALHVGLSHLREFAASSYESSASPGYKLHDLYRMKLDEVLKGAAAIRAARASNSGRKGGA